MEFYLIFKALHLISVISWLAALLYLPRILYYHSQKNIKKETSEVFKIMEKKLSRIIMTPAMIATVIFGLILIHFIGFSQIWLHIKLLFLLPMFCFHFFLLKSVRNFANDKNKYSEKFFKIINEIPAILMIIIVFIAILKPF